MSMFLILGAPGAGKSTYVEKYLGELPLLSCDEMREKYFGYKRTFEIRCKVFELLLEEIEEMFRKGEAFVVDTTYFNDRESRRILTRKVPSNKIDVIFIDKTLEECISQNLDRPPHRRISDDMIELLFERIDIPLEQEAFHSVTNIT